MMEIIFSNELKYWFRTPAFYGYSFAFFLLAAGTMAGSAGILGGDAADTPVLANSPEEVFSLMNLFLKLLLLVLPAIFGHSVYRDFRSNVYQLMFTFPFTRSDYLSGKFLSAFLIAGILAVMTGLGMIAGTQLPGVLPARMAPFDVGVYIHVFGIYIFPAIFLFGIAIFAATVFSRNLYSGFICIIIFLVLREIAARLLGSADSLWALADPLGEAAKMFYTQSRTISEQNYLPLPLENWVIFNRLLWLGLAVAGAAITYRRFSFYPESIPFRAIRKRAILLGERQSGGGVTLNSDLPTIRLSFFHQLKISWKIAGMEFYGIVTSGSFLSMLAVGLMFTFVLLAQMNPPYGARVLPLTWVMLAFPVLFYSLLIVAMTFLYAGVLIHRPSLFRMNEWVDTTPVSDLTLLFSRFLALVKMQVLLLSMIFVAGTVVQLWQGLYKIEVGHYLFALFCLHLPGFVIWAFVSVFVQTVFSHTYSGLFVLIIGALGVSYLPALGVEELIFRFNENPDPSFFLKYSEISGYGLALRPFFLYKLYWSLFGLVLFGGAWLLWQRGLYASFLERLFYMRWRLNSGKLIFLLVSLAAFLVLGINLYQKPEAVSEKQTKTVMLKADKKYGRYIHFPQPRITRVNVKMDLFPESSEWNASGEYVMVNKSGRVVDTLLLHYAPEMLTSFFPDRNTRTIVHDTTAHLDILVLEERLEPGDSMRLHFAIEPQQAGFLPKSTPVLKDGTFFTSVVFPGLGYESPYLQFSPDDSAARQNHYRSSDADYIDFEAIVSTAEDQIAIVPGYLDKEWTESGRHYFSYRSREKTTRDFVFLSGHYEVRKGKWKNVDLEIYYHKGHEYNLGHMMRSLKATLSYNENHFSPYQHKQIRIVEFSRALGEYAQSFATTIPYSEIGFVMNTTAEDELNFPFIGVSHELSHQWWGHQVIPANVSGIRMITEGLAEYNSLKVLEQEYGENHGRLFREKALKTYLKKRVEDADEKPLMYNSGLEKSYIPYQKGSLAFYAMSDYLGEDCFHDLLKTWLEDVRFRGAPYTTCTELVNYIKSETPDSLAYLVHDWFESVTVYDNKVIAADAWPLANGKYQVNLVFDVHKSDNTHKEQPLADYVEIGIFTEPGHSGFPQTIYLKKHKITQNQNTLSLVVDEIPLQAGIDPMTKLIDLHPGDNRIAVRLHK
ncbi:MAG: M1 family aminopeptidase [Bacteroidia bacterium]